MRKNGTTRSKAPWLVFALVLAFCFPVLCQANMLGLAEIGARGGFSDSNSDQHFEQYEAFTVHKLPWSWDLSANWAFETRVNVTAGALISSGSTAFVGTLGPGFAFTWKGLSIFAGVSPTYLSKKKFEVEDFGGEFQFTSHGGLSYEFFKNFAAGYRIQHMSNAGIYDENPGLNLHMFELKYVF